MKHLWFSCLLLGLLTCVPTLSSGENILFFFGVSTYSHRIAVWPLVESLVKKGHNVTFFSSFEAKSANHTNPKVHDYVPDNLLNEMGSSMDLVKLRLIHGAQAIEKAWSEYAYMGVRLCNRIMKREDIKDWIKRSKFDVIVIDSLFNDCGYGLVEYYNAIRIEFCTTSVFPWFSESFGFSEEGYPEVTYHYPPPKEMTFFQRVSNTLRVLYWYFFKRYYMYPAMEDSLKETFGLSDKFSMAKIDGKVDLVLVNSHFTDEYPRSLPPLLQLVGGLHVRETTLPLPQDIAKEIEKYEEGFIYVSFGTFCKISNLPEKEKASLFQVFRMLNKYLFIVLWDGPVPKDAPKNALFKPWISQQDVLAHPKIKAFVSHGGLLGIQEAIYHGVPTMAIPIFAEQDYNADRIHYHRRGLKFDISQLHDSQKFLKALEELLKNPEYREKTEQLAKLHKDRPMKPTDQALWWTEYVIRNKGGEMLRPHSVHDNWFRRRQLDIWAFLFLSSVSTLLFMIFVVQRCCLRVTKNRRLLLLYEKLKKKKDS